MKSRADFSPVTPRGWAARYSEIAREFGLSPARDAAAARLLDSLLDDPVPVGELRAALAGRTVFVAGAGPSLGAAVPAMGRFPGVPVMAADSAAGALLAGGVRPYMVFTDLDGDPAALREAGGAGAVMAVHAHGDNAGRLGMAPGLGRCIGTTQVRPVGRLSNFGGFTDGDRCVFAADALGAGRIVLFGMDLGGRIGRHSGTAPSERRLKLRKLRRARALLAWLAGRSGAELYTTSGSIPGFRRIGYGDLGRVAAP